MGVTPGSQLLFKELLTPEKSWAIEPGLEELKNKQTNKQANLDGREVRVDLGRIGLVL